jgi:hydroxymethylglutaryl-CoA lyase
MQIGYLPAPDMKLHTMKIIECPRDAMQGLVEFIPTSDKIRYIDQLLKIGFDTLDVGSFVSPKAIPQMRDTPEVLNGIAWESSPSSLLAIVANVRGAIEACSHDAITFLGFPLSLSETFQQRNTNRSIKEALQTVDEIQETCIRRSKILVTYISMGFGNPYHDPYDVAMVAAFVEELSLRDIKIISLADTIGVATPGQIGSLYSSIAAEFPRLEIGLHLHSHPATADGKIVAAIGAGCSRLDGALKGFGGCPLAEDELVGNVATEMIIDRLDKANAPPQLDRGALRLAMTIADEILSGHI